MRFYLNVGLHEPHIYLENLSLRVPCFQPASHALCTCFSLYHLLSESVILLATWVQTRRSWFRPHETSSCAFDVDTLEQKRLRFIHICCVGLHTHTSVSQTGSGAVSGHGRLLHSCGIRLQPWSVREVDQSSDVWVDKDVIHAGAALMCAIFVSTRPVYGWSTRHSSETLTLPRGDVGVALDGRLVLQSLGHCRALTTTTFCECQTPAAFQNSFLLAQPFERCFCGVAVFPSSEPAL